MPAEEGPRRRVSFRRPLIVAALSLGLLGGVEGFLAALAHSPDLARTIGSTAVASRLYLIDRDVLQLDRTRGRWDPEISYTLRPGTHRFSGAEFDITVQINSLGVRDTEEALEGAEILFLGDSFAMGWGVAKEETFVHRVGALTGLRTLNLGVPSFGTARQLQLLDRVDRTRARWLVIQYSSNDFLENRTAQEHDFALPILDEATFHDLVDGFQAQRTYKPGRYVWSLMRYSSWWRRTPEERRGARLGTWGLPDLGSPATQSEQVRSFLDVLLHSPVDLSGIPILVVELNSHNLHPDGFVEALQEMLDENPDSLNGIQILPLPLGATLGTEDWFVLDDHMTGAGHEQVARAISRAVEDPPVPRRERDPG